MAPEPDSIDTVEQLIARWKRADAEGVLELLTEDVVYHYHVGSRPLVGRDVVRRFLERFGSGQKDKNWRIVHHAQNGNTLLVEGVDDFVNAEGRRIRTPYMGVFEFEAGRIRGWRDYHDMAVMQRCEAGEPLPDYLEELADRGDA